MEIIFTLAVLLFAVFVSTHGPVLYISTITVLVLANIGVFIFNLKNRPKRHEPKPQ